MAGKLMFVVLTIIIAIGNFAHGYELKQLLILSRHNIRSPLNSNLEMITQKSWPVWQYQLGHLTEKGAQLEGYLGEYFSEWFKQRDGWFFEECPEADSSVFFANSPQRTIETAKAFVKSAFKDCNVSVHYNPTLKMDPVFNPIISDDTESFYKTILTEIESNTNKTAVGLKSAYLILNKILDFKNSDICRKQILCDLSKGHDIIRLQVGEEPEVTGPLFYANAAVDALLMAYYNGMPSEDIGWGLIEPEHWKLLTKITKQHQIARFNSTTLAKHVAKPLLKYMLENIFSSEKIKLAVLVGHDSNINSVMKALDVKYYKLPAQNELTPIGGKVVFQKFHSKKLKRDFVKISYVYLTTEQLRKGTKLSLDNPPMSIDLEINGCSSSANESFCLWNYFMAVMEKSIQ